MRNDDYTIKAITKAERIMEALAESRKPMSLSDVVRYTGLNKDFCFRALKTLESMRWVECVGDHYRLGIGLAKYYGKYVARREAERDNISRELVSLGAEA